MADSSASSSSRSRRTVSSSSHHSHLLHTIAQLRRMPESSADSSFSGMRRLRKAYPHGNQLEPSANTLHDLNDGLEDFSDTENTKPLCNVDELVDGLDQLAIGKKSNANVPSIIPSRKPKILDKYAALIKDKVPIGLDTSAETNQVVVCISDSDNSDTTSNGSSSNRFSPPSLTKKTSYSHEDAEVVVLSQGKARISGSNKEVRQKNSPTDDVVPVWNPEDEKENAEVESVTSVNGRSVFKLPEKIGKILFAHQHEGIKWLWELHAKGMGGILGDDMGLGKTMQIAAFLAGLFSSGLIKCAMIVAPKTLIAHWSKELAFVGLGRRTKDYSGCAGSGREFALQHVLQVGGILLTTYDVVRNNWKALRGDFHGRDGYGDRSEDILTWDYIVLDEGHLIKNPTTQRAKSLREIPCAHRIVLSGTPIQNNLREMWALFDFCCPELLGDKKEFKARYEDAILSANSKDATDRQRRIGSSVAQELRKRIAPFFLRRLKSEVFGTSGDAADQKLSRKNDIIVWLRLTERQRQLYTAFLESEAAHRSLDGSALAALTVLKKICDHPSLLTHRAAEDIAEGMESLLEKADAEAADAMLASVASLLDADEHITGSHRAISCKIAFIMSLLENLVDEGHRTLIFAQTRKMLDIIQKEIISKGYLFRRIDGTMKASDREKYVQEFQTDSDISVFLLTSQVGGLGLTLTGADRVIIVDPAWNPSTDNQSVDRAYRIGQKSDVLIYRLMTSGTIEEKIYRKQVFKGGLFKVATEHKEQFRYFSQQELRELLTLPETGFDMSVTQQQLHEEHRNQYERDEQLTEHIKFLESQNIVGVSHHDLLFSKQDPKLPSSEPFIRRDSGKIQLYGGGYGQLESRPLHDLGRVKSDQKKTAYGTLDTMLDGQKLEISAKISRLTQTLADQATVSRLPDHGENLRRKLMDLNNQLQSLQYLSTTEERKLEMASSPEESFIGVKKTCETENDHFGTSTECVADKFEHILYHEVQPNVPNSARIDLTKNTVVDRSSEYLSETMARLNLSRKEGM